MSCVVSLCYLQSREFYDIKREDRSGKGFVDFIFYPKRPRYPAIVLELKYGKSAIDAINQIKEKNSIQRVSDFKEIYIVGINYDEDKHHREGKGFLVHCRCIRIFFYLEMNACV